MISVIGVQAYGVDHNIWPNKILAQIAINKLNELEGGLIATQRDIYCDNGSIQVSKIKGEKPGAPPPTLRMMRFFVEEAVRINAGEIWLVCAPQHLWRCKRDLKKAIEERDVNMELCVCEDISSYKNSDFYCKDSDQPRTQNAFNWWLREIILIISPFWLYKKVAS